MHGAETDLHAIEPRKSFEVGPFAIEPLRVTHSTPDSIALAIRTPAGIIVHSGDFKIDDAPVDGQKFDTEALRRAWRGRRRAAALGFHQRRAGRAHRLGKLAQTDSARADFAHHESFFPVGVFLAHPSHSAGRRSVARSWPPRGSARTPDGRERAPRDGDRAARFRARHCSSSPTRPSFIEPRKLTYLASGSQGEPFSALAKLAIDNHPRVHVENGDMVVLSSRFIPGNERAINSLVNQLYKLGAEVIYDAVAPVHVSGHASRDELADLIALVKPRYFVPIHGEYRHLSRHLALADRGGNSGAQLLPLEDGDSLVLDWRRGLSEPQGAYRPHSDGGAARPKTSR